MPDIQLPAQQQQAQYVTGARGVNVQYGTSYRAPISKNFGGYERPSINIDIGRAMSTVMQGISESRATDKQREEEVNYNIYATEVNRIVQGQRQGAYTVEEAGNRIRALDDNYLAMGYDSVKLAQIRTKYDGGIYSAVEAVQKKNEEAEAQRKLDSYDEFRKRYSFAQSWSNTRVESYLGELNSFEDKINNMTQMMSNPSMTEEDRLQIKLQRDEVFKQLGIQNAMNETYKKLSENPEKSLTPNDLITLRRNIMNDYVQHGGTIHEAAPIADAIIQSMGLDTVSNMLQQDVEHANQYISNINKNQENLALQQFYDRFPFMATFAGLPDRVLETGLSKGSTQQAMLNVFQHTVDYTPNKDGSITWIWNDKPITSEDSSVAMMTSLYNTNEAASKSNYPNKLFINGVKTNEDMVDEYARQTVLSSNLSDEDRSVAFKNLRNMTNSVQDTLAKGSGKITDEKTKKELQTRSSALSWIAHESDRHKPNASILNQLSMTDRQGGIRMMDDGTLAMVKDHPSYSAWNYFSDTHRLCEEFNNATRNLTPDTRKALIDNYVEGIIPYNKNLDGDVDDMSPQWRDRIKDFLPGALEYGKGLVNTMNENNRLNVEENERRRNRESEDGEIVTSTISGSTTFAFPSMVTPSGLEEEIGKYDRYISELTERSGEDWSGVVDTLREKQNELIKQRMKMPDTQQDIIDTETPIPSEYEQHVTNSARQYGVEPELVDAVAFKESSRGRHIVSKDGGAIGIMQVRKPALTDAIKAGVVPAGTKLEDLKDAEIGAKVGTWYLSQQLKTFDNDEVKALAAYNQGPGWVRAAIRAANNKDRWLEEAATKGFTMGRKKISPQYVRNVVVNYIRPILQERDKA